MNKQYILIGIFVLLGLGSFVFFQSGGASVEGEHHDDDDDVVAAHEIYPGDVVEKISAREDIVLLDVRTPEEYAEVHLKNAFLLPVQEMSASSLAGIGLGENAKDREIIIYCRSGARSQTAYNIMNSLGYTNIKSVAGGMIHWQEDEYPFTQHSTKLSAGFTEVGEYKGGIAADIVDSVAGAPKITLNRAFHDFGEITQYGGTVEAQFTIINDGESELSIGDITTSCSCTSASVSSERIGPGGTATLAVVFDPDFHEEPLGVFKRTVFIPTNDPVMPEAEVVVQVDILEGQ